MDAEVFDWLTQRLATGVSRRGALQTALGASALGMQGIANTEVGDAAKSGKCKPNCNQCQYCQKGTCRKKRGKKTCKAGKCWPLPTGSDCDTNPCRECQDGVCANKLNDTTCSGTGKCLNGTCNTRPDCIGVGDDTSLICVNDTACCSGVCNILPTFTFGYCAEGDSGTPCTARADCASFSCIGYRCT